MPGGKCHIGTSGWSYAHWAKGRFYPKGMKPGEWLRFFARHFDTVEINSSFYRLPKPDFVSRWRQVTGSRFRFAVKLWRRITHLKRLADCSRQLEDFFEIAGLLGPKRGPLLVQLPPSMRKDVARLDAFLTDLKKATGRSRWKVAVEFRNTDWLCKEIYELLNRHRVALCLADMERCPITEPNDVSFVYLRRHGPGGRYRGCYGAAHIAADADRIRGWLQAGREVFVYYNNDIDGHAVDNAHQLIEMVGPARSSARGTAL
jgi:uncharacterized protein YecE (DUF72 family)